MRHCTYDVLYCSALDFRLAFAHIDQEVATMPHLIKIASASLLAILLSACTATPHTPASAPPEVAAAAQGGPRIEQFRQAVEADREALKIPGLSVAVMENDQPLWAEGFGYADLENKVPATPDTLYHLASVTKTFTAILVHRLAEQGKLDLDEPVSRYSKDFNDDRVRIRHLLSHTSDGPVPGERFSYNPERFEYLKTILEQKTGKPLRQLFVETFLDPLDMRDSVPGPDLARDAGKWPMLRAANLERYPQVLKRFAEPYTYYGDGEILHDSYPPDDFWVSAGLLSTVRDMAKYDAAVDRHALLTKATLDKAWTPVLSNAGQPLPMGLGWWITDYRGTRLVYHYGHWGTGFSALYLKVPSRRLSMVMFANSEALADHHYQINEDVTNDLFACAFLQTFVPDLATASGPSSSFAAPDCAVASQTALTKWITARRNKARKPIGVDPAILRTYVGGYDVPERRVFNVTEEDGHLYLDVGRGGRTEMFAETPDTFFLKTRPWTMRFVKEGGKVTRLDISQDTLTLKSPRVK
jgi:CubicO group peptidase (beta-lactamase class C family)